MKKLSESVDNAVENVAPLVMSEVQAGCSRSSVSRLESSGVKDADLAPLGKQIQELQAEVEDLLKRRDRDEKLQIDTLLKLCSDKKRLTRLESKVKRFTTLLTKNRLRAGND